jgi:hypothetical protein
VLHNLTSYVGAHDFVMHPPAFDDGPGLAQRGEPMRVQALIAELAIKLSTCPLVPVFVTWTAAPTTAAPDSSDESQQRSGRRLANGTDIQQKQGCE